LGNAQDRGRLRAGNGTAVYPLHLIPHSPPQGRSVDEYRAPLFIFGSSRIAAAGLRACCEASGPGNAWRRTERGRVGLARRITIGHSLVAFGGGEPLSVAHCWEIFDQLTAAGVSLKIETDGTRIDDAAADRLAALAVQCVQVSVDGANRTTHERVRPGISFDAATGAIRRLLARGLAPQCVFVPTRINLGEMQSVYDLAASLAAAPSSPDH
jgi:MoaA/NifB/PqqE/SkfB family radical SAM enzyme